MSAPLGFSVQTEGSISPHRVRVLNKTAGASVAGYGVKFITTTAFGVGLYSRVGYDNIVSLVGVVEKAGVADGNYMAIQLAKPGHILTVNFSAAAVAGQYAIADPVNAGRFVSSATFVPGQTLGIIMVAIGGAGNTTVMVVNLNPYIDASYGAIISPRGNNAGPSLSHAPLLAHTSGNVVELYRVAGGTLIFRIPYNEDVVYLNAVYSANDVTGMHMVLKNTSSAIRMYSNTTLGVTQYYLLKLDTGQTYDLRNCIAGENHRNVIGSAYGTYGGGGFCWWYPHVQGIVVPVYIDNVGGCALGDYITVSAANAGQCTAVAGEPAEYLGRATTIRANPGSINMRVQRRVT